MKNFFYNSIHWFYLIVGIIFLVLFIGLLTNKKWAIDRFDYNQRFLFNILGPYTYRIFVGILLFLGSISSLLIFFVFF